MYHFFQHQRVTSVPDFEMNSREMFESSEEPFEKRWLLEYESVEMETEDFAGDSVCSFTSESDVDFCDYVMDSADEVECIVTPRSVDEMSMCPGFGDVIGLIFEKLIDFNVTDAMVNPKPKSVLRIEKPKRLSPEKKNSRVKGDQIFANAWADITRFLMACKKTYSVLEDRSYWISMHLVCSRRRETLHSGRFYRAVRTQEEEFERNIYGLSLLELKQNLLDMVYGKTSVLNETHGCMLEYVSPFVRNPVDMIMESMPPNCILVSFHVDPHDPRKFYYKKAEKTDQLKNLLVVNKIHYKGMKDVSDRYNIKTHLMNKTDDWVKERYKCGGLNLEGAVSGE